MSKSPDAFRTISEVADWLGVQAHVLRFWESRFTQVKPVKRAGGRRYYRPNDMRLLGGIKKLLHEDGITIKGVQRILREQGVAHVASLSPSLDENAPAPSIDDTVVPPARTARLTSKWGGDSQTIELQAGQYSEPYGYRDNGTSYLVLNYAMHYDGGPWTERVGPDQREFRIVFVVRVLSPL